MKLSNKEISFLQNLENKCPGIVQYAKEHIQEDIVSPVSTHLRQEILRKIFIYHVGCFKKKINFFYIYKVMQEHGMYKDGAFANFIADIRQLNLFFDKDIPHPSKNGSFTRENRLFIDSLPFPYWEIKGASPLKIANAKAIGAIADNVVNGYNLLKEYHQEQNSNYYLDLVDNKEKHKLCTDIITKYHSYKRGVKTIGRKIDWLIYKSGEMEPCGMIGISSAPYPASKDLLTFLDISLQQYQKELNNIANNWRFCIKESTPNGGSQILSLLRKEAPLAWKKKYGDDLKMLVTFVGNGHLGTVYKADNWQYIGKTSGLPEHKSIFLGKQKSVVPNGEDKKLIFVIKL